MINGEIRKKNKKHGKVGWLLALEMEEGKWGMRGKGGRKKGQ